MKLGLVLCVCLCFAYACVCPTASVQKNKKKPSPAKVISLVAWEFGKAPRILCRQWQRSSTKLLWGCRYLCRTPAAKVTALLQITTVDPQPFMMPSVSWLSKEPCIICNLEGGGEMRKQRGVLKWPTTTRGWGMLQWGIETGPFVLRCCTPRIRCCSP